MLDSDLRVSELVGIDINDVNLGEGNIKIRQAKGNKERLVPIGCLVQKSLWKYINHYRPQPLPDKITGLFLSDTGLPLTKSGVQQMLRGVVSRQVLQGYAVHHIHYAILSPRIIFLTVVIFFLCRVYSAVPVWHRCVSI